MIGNMARTDRRPRHRLDPDSRRTAILDAATGIFATHPYSQVTLSSIAEAAEGSTPLVYRYFDGKEGLYAEVVRQAIDSLLSAQTRALEALPDGVPTRDRIRTATLVYLDHIARRPGAWATPLRQPGGEPASAAALRERARADDVERLAALLEPSDRPRHRYAMWGYLGFVDAACLRWVEHGCPPEERWELIDAALGALEGALGDWAA